MEISISKSKQILLQYGRLHAFQIAAMATAISFRLENHLSSVLFGISIDNSSIFVT